MLGGMHWNYYAIGWDDNHVLQDLSDGILDNLDGKLLNWYVKLLSGNDNRIGGVFVWFDYGFQVPWW